MKTNKEKKKKKHDISFTLTSFIKKEDKILLNFLGYQIQGPEVIIRKKNK